MEEAKKQQSEISDLKDKLEYQLNQITILVSTLRLPRMSEQFRRAVKKQNKPETYKKHEQEAITTLSKYIDEKNEEKFYEDFIQKVMNKRPTR